jgi:hypothetical protein
MRMMMDADVHKYVLCSDFLIFVAAATLRSEKTSKRLEVEAQFDIYTYNKQAQRK